MSNIHEPAPDVVAELSPDGEITTATLGASGPENVTVVDQVPAALDLDDETATAEPVGLATAGLESTVANDAALAGENGPETVIPAADATVVPPAPTTEAPADV